VANICEEKRIHLSVVLLLLERYLMLRLMSSGHLFSRVENPSPPQPNRKGCTLESTYYNVSRIWWVNEDDRQRIFGQRSGAVASVNEGDL